MQPMAYRVTCHSICRHVKSEVAFICLSISLWPALGQYTKCQDAECDGDDNEEEEEEEEQDLLIKNDIIGHWCY